jgi:hypothetical protein
MAHNGLGDAMQAFTLTVNQAPAVTGPAVAAFRVGAAKSVVVAASGFPTPTLATGDVPDGVTLTDNHDGTATLGGTPAPGPGVARRSRSPPPTASRRTRRRPSRRR